MPSKVYVGDVGTKILLDTGSNITTATVIEIRYKKPFGDTGSWTAIVEDTTKLYYITIAGDFNEAGEFIVQAYVETPAWIGHGEEYSFNVVEPRT